MLELKISSKCLVEKTSIIEGAAAQQQHCGFFLQGAACGRCSGSPGEQLQPLHVMRSSGILPCQAWRTSKTLALGNSNTQSIDGYVSFFLRLVHLGQIIHPQDITASSSSLNAESFSLHVLVFVFSIEWLKCDVNPSPREEESVFDHNCYEEKQKSLNDHHKDVSASDVPTKRIPHIVYPKSLENIHELVLGEVDKSTAQAIIGKYKEDLLQCVVHIDKFLIISKEFQNERN